MVRKIAHADFLKTFVMVGGQRDEEAIAFSFDFYRFLKGQTRDSHGMASQPVP
jgi:hypothetical protein